jgi:putative transposase
VDIGRELISMNKFPIKLVCDSLRISRSNIYQNRKHRSNRYRRKDDDQVLMEIKEIAKNRSTYGVRRTTGMLRRRRRKAGLSPYNRKRIRRLMDMHNLLLRRPGKRDKRAHEGKVITLKSDLRYSSDIMEIKCWNGEKIFIGFSLDCHDREIMHYVAEKRPLLHTDIIRLMDETVFHRFGDSTEKLPHRIEWLSDNGGQYVANNTRNNGQMWGFEVCTTPSYSPESNGASEAFVKTFKRDYVYTNELPNANTVLERLASWFHDYNEIAPHSGLDYLSPREYRYTLNKVSV